jgi:FAD synthase
MYVFKGHIQAGRGRASKLGFPTVNLPMAHSIARGIFAAEVRAKGKVCRAVAYADTEREVLEAHIVDGSSVPNGEIEIELLHKLREGKAFASEQELKHAIASDVRAAKAYFSI